MSPTTRSHTTATKAPSQGEQLRKLEDFLGMCRRSGVIDFKVSDTLDVNSSPRYKADYQLCLHDWRATLEREQRENASTSGVEAPAVYHSKLDRIWWTSLGAQNILSSFHSRYTSFRLAESHLANALYSRGERLETVDVTDGLVTVIHLSSWNHQDRTLEFACEQWRLSGPPEGPKLDKKQIICTDEESTNWSLYARSVMSDHVRLAARPTFLSDGGALLRIGAQLFVLDSERAYQPLPSPEVLTGGNGSYFEEFAGRGPFIAIASRAHTVAQGLQKEFRSVDGFGETFERFEALASGDYEESDSESDEDETDDFLDASSESDGRESWSEGSTDVEEAVDSDSDESDSASVKSSSSSSWDADSVKTPVDEAQVDGNSRPDMPEMDIEGPDPLDAKSVASEDSLPPSVISAPDDQESDDEDGSWSPFRVYKRGPVFEPVRPRLGEREIVLTILETQPTGPPTKLFQFKHPLSSMLYASPPAFHPSKPLVVWPIGAGTVLFADFAEKTYHVQELRPSSPYSRNVSMKVHFSPCAQYLHIASLEAQPDHGNDSESRRRSRSSPIGLRVDLLLSTYRLSSHKTARSPPLLVHRMKATLGKHTKLNVSRLPFTFTWTKEDLFVTQRATALSVLRIALFRAGGSTSASEPHVLAPKDAIILPDTTARRDVHFAPMGDSTYTIILGSESSVDNSTSALPKAVCTPRGILSPPVGCFLQVTDFDGWVDSESIAVPKGQGIGRLSPPRVFSFIEGCHIEPWLDAA